MGEMDALECSQQYFDAWNRRDADSVLATFAADGTYCDPASGGRLRGEALKGYMAGLWAAFPDLSFEIMNLFREINARGTTVVVATHDRELIRRVGRRAVTLDQGRVVEVA